MADTGLLGSFPSCQVPGKQDAGRRYWAEPMHLPDHAAPCGTGQWLSSRLEILKGWGQKSPQTVVNRKQPVYCLLRCFHRGKKKKKSEVQYAKEIPEPRRNSKIILSNNLLLNETVIWEKKLPVFFPFILNGKTTKSQIGAMEVKIQIKRKTFSCCHLPLSSATWLWKLFY